MNEAMGASIHGQGGIATLENGETVDVLAIQAVCNSAFQETGKQEYADAANELSKITGKVQGPHGDWLDADDAPNGRLHDFLRAADLVTIDGYLIEDVQDHETDASGNLVLRCACDEDNEFFFIDQDVRLTAFGELFAMTAPGYPSGEDEQVEVHCALQMVRQMRVEDVVG